jgi:hypothetical protein
MAIRAETYALARPVPYLLERGYQDAAGVDWQTIEAPIRRTSDGAVVAVTAVGSTVTVTAPGGVVLVNAAAVTVADGVARYTFTAGAPTSSQALGEGYTVEWALVIDGEVYTYRHAAILCQYVPPNSVTAADLYGGDGVAELVVGAPRSDGRDGLQSDAGRVGLFVGPVSGSLDLDDADRALWGDHPGDQERHQIVKREEAVQCRVVDREAAPEEDHNALANKRDGREQVGNHRRAPEAHLAPRQNITHESCCHH